MHDVADFKVDDLIVLSRDIARLAEAADTMADAAQRVAQHLHLVLCQGGHPATALVRLYKTHRYDALDPDDRLALGPDVGPSTSCLTLLGTAGVEPAWNDRRRSSGHRSIPLTGEAAISRLPMISALFDELGFDVGAVLRPDAESQVHHRDFGLFFVPDARSSRSIPDQDGFVVPYGIRSVLGVGGFLPSGEAFALLCFFTVPVARHVADLFRTVALSIKASFVPLTYRVFATA